MNHRYFTILLILGVFAVGNLIPVNFVFGAMYQNLNPTGDQTVAPASANFESGEVVWVNNTFVVRTRAGGTGTLRNLQLTTGASNVGLLVNSVGNVGIGTTQANNKFNVVGGIDLGIVDTSNLFRLNYNATDGGTLQSFIGGANAKMSLNPGGGNVGIGTTGPTAKLDVRGNLIHFGNQWATTDVWLAGAAGWALNLHGDTAYSSIIDSRGALVLGANGAEAMRIISTGNVSIATTTPSYKLDVVGTSQFSQPVIVGTPTANTHATTKSYVDSMFTGSGQWTTNGGLVYLTSTTQNVGVGTTGPGYKLEVDTNNYYYSAINSGGTIKFGDVNTASNMIIGISGVYGSAIQGRDGTSAGNLVLNPYGGNVGIGTTNPSTRLTISKPIDSTAYGAGTQMIDFKSYYPGYDVDTVKSSIYGGVSARGVLNTQGGYLAFMTSNDGALAERVRIEKDGNVGIGTTGPLAPLHIESTGGVGKGIYLKSTSAGSYAPIDFQNDSGLNGQFLSTGSTFGNGGFGGNELILAAELATSKLHLAAIGASGVIKFTTGGLAVTDERMRIIQTGNIGIATTTPSYKLDVVGTSQFSQPVIVGTPTVSTHATTKSYVDSMFTGSGQWTTSGTNIYSTLVGNVGIGTTGPDRKLDVRKDVPAASGTVPIALFGNLSGNWGNYAMIETKNIPDGRSVRFGSYLGGSAYSQGGFAVVTGTDGAIDTSPSVKLFVRHDGNVGIGTITPGAKLETYSASGDVYQYLTTGSGVTMQSIAAGNTYGWVGTRTNHIFYVGANNGYVASFTPGGNVGIATSTPNYSLTVNGYGWFNQPVIVGTPVSTNHAATKSYVDSIIGGSTSSTSNYVLKTGDAMSGNLNMNGSNITAVNKLTVTTIDPLYEIGGVKYSTYASAIVGGVKEEFVGRGRLEKISKDKLQMILDFSKVEKGSDLWVWYNAIDFSKDNVEVLATAYNIPIPIAYTIKNNSIIFNAISNEGIEFSYRLVGKRFDWRKWPTYAKDQNEPAGLIIK